MLMTNECTREPSQLAERAVFQMRQRGGGGAGAAAASRWQLEEAQVFWVKGEQGLALDLLRGMIHNLKGQVGHTRTRACTHAPCPVTFP